MLSILATPIGNLEDLSIRAVHILKRADLILCEDTRRTKILLQHIEASATPCISYHTWNETQQIGNILEQLQNGKNIVLAAARPRHLRLGTRQGAGRQL